MSVGGGVERRRREPHTCINISLFGKIGGGIFKEIRTFMGEYMYHALLPLKMEQSLIRLHYYKLELCQVC